MVVVRRSDRAQLAWVPEVSRCTNRAEGSPSGEALTIQWRVLSRGVPGTGSRRCNRAAVRRERRRLRRRHGSAGGGDRGLQRRRASLDLVVTKPEGGRVGVGAAGRRADTAVRGRRSTTSRGDRVPSRSRSPTSRAMPIRISSWRTPTRARRRSCRGNGSGGFGSKRDIIGGSEATRGRGRGPERRRNP